MDESWRMRIGLTSYSRRRSTEETSSIRRKSYGANTSDSGDLTPDDFSDVFGGPPRTVLCRRFSGKLANSSENPRNFYDEVFRRSNSISGIGSPFRGGRSLPVFTIPSRNGGGVGFYDDVFGSEDDRRSRSRSSSNSKGVSKSKSKSTSSSVLSSEELSPIQAVIGEDIGFASFASKLREVGAKHYAEPLVRVSLGLETQGSRSNLRPINVPSRWNSSIVMPEEHRTKLSKPAYSCNHPFNEDIFHEKEHCKSLKSFCYGFSRQVSSPETLSIDPNSSSSFKVSMDDLEFKASSSAVSSLCQDLETKPTDFDEVEFRKQDVVKDEDDGDEIISSYVIEINSDHREGSGESMDINEAIAWAKERLMTNSNSNWNRHKQEEFVETEGRHHMADETTVEQVNGDDHPTNSQVEKAPIISTTAGQKQRLCKDVLWPTSGWCAIPLSSLIEAPHVKKAYQKARLCLHPDKLQQRSATLSQKYVAEKAFAILQEAWAAFISQDVFSG
ncbi:hypothetical protein RJ641_001778 [Dillenia turbinata]|uniref:J domain-containing protein n=1 Tax=Dillenia turbinata TaxID=194707 RepID=A0AAN8VEQ3_9MAGN